MEWRILYGIYSSPDGVMGLGKALHGRFYESKQNVRRVRSLPLWQMITSIVQSAFPTDFALP